MQRRQFLKSTSVALAATLSGCGGGDSGGAAASNASTPAPTPGPAPAPAPAPAPGSAPSLGNLPTLTLHPTQSVVGPYTAAVFPLQGLVPSGQGIDSPDDPAMRSTVISRWPDGSASVVVLAGETSVSLGASKQVRLRAAAVGSTPLTAARVGQLVSNVTVNCGAVGSATFDNLATPSKVWWANERVICCRYRAPIGAHPTLEAVVDIHAFSSNRALVEVVVENCKMATATPAIPTSAGYTATVSVNGATVANVQTANAPGVTHQPFRAWYASSWVGGDPGIDVTHDPSSMQAHPLFFRVWKAGGSMAQYAGDAYQAWGVGRHPARDMGAGGDAAQLGPLPKWEVQYLQSGDNQVRRAVIASALSVLSFNVNYRDAGTGLVPTFDQLANKNQQESDSSRAWPNNGAEPSWQQSHHPAAGLMAFMCRPSPAFIEIAQKIAVSNGTSSSYDGTFGTYYQTRGKAWCTRSLAHAIFLTPDADAWKQAGRSALFRNVQLLKTFQEDPKSGLGFLWAYSPGFLYDFVDAVGGDGSNGFIQPLWQHHYLVTELHKAANAKLLSGAEQSALVAIADWVAAQPLRYINESAGGEWRFLYYLTPVGRNRTTIDSMPTWAQQFAWRYGDGPPPVSGPWMNGNWASTSYSSASMDSGAGAFYPSYFWAALVAAVERGLPGSDAAWSKVMTNVTNLSTWSAGFAADPRWGAYPRNK